MAYNDLPPLGQTTKSASLPVTVASDQDVLATSAKQDTIIGHLDGVEGILTTIDADTSTLAGAVAGTEVQVDIVASIPAGTNNIGDVDILSIAAGDNNIGNVDVVTLPSIPAGTNNIGDVDVLTMPGTGVEDAAETVGGTLLMAGTVRRDTAASSAGTTGDNATINTDSVGALWTRDTASQVDDAAFTAATSRILPVGFLADETATDSVDEGDAGAARMTLDRKQIVANYAHAAGGATPYKLVSAATTNATSVKASAGTVYMITASNVNAAVRYLKLYNKASAPTVGTDTPVFTFAIPGNTAGAGTNIPLPAMGAAFGTGIAFALTTEATDAGTTAVAANEIVVNLAYT